MEKIREQVFATMCMTEEEAIEKNLVKLLRENGEIAFLAIAERNGLNFIPVSEIKECIDAERISLLTCFSVLINNYLRIDEILGMLVGKAKTYELGYNLLYIKDRKLQTECLKVYYSKIYPTSIDKVFNKLNEDNLIFDAPEHCQLFVEYWEKFGKPQLSEHIVEECKSHVDFEHPCTNVVEKLFR